MWDSSKVLDDASNPSLRSREVALSSAAAKGPRDRYCLKCLPPWKLHPRRPAGDPCNMSADVECILRPGLPRKLQSPFSGESHLGKTDWWPTEHSGYLARPMIPGTRKP